MNAIDFVIRTRTGAIERGSIGGENQGVLIDAGSGNDISLNIRQSDLRGYDRAGDDLLVTLADGRVIVLQGYFDAGAEGANRLFLSANSILNEVTFVEAEGGALFAQYGPTESWGKWSPSDELIFVQDPHVAAQAVYAEDEEVSMLAAGLLGASGLGAAGLGAAGLGAAALLGLGDGDGGGGSGGGGGGWNAPTVDNPDAETNIGGDDDPRIVITGTGNPGSEVVVVIGEDTVIGVSDDDGVWDVIFEGDDFPDDGIYEDVDVTVTDPNGTVTDLDGPSFAIDTVPPAVEATSGTTSVGDLFNGEGYDAGVAVSGTAEIGSIVTLTIGDWSGAVTVGDSGTWTIAIDGTTLPAGEYTSGITITATDSFGNSTVLTDSIEIDTVPHPLTIDAVTGDALVNGAEADAGFEITGTSTAGAIVTVTFQGVTQDVLVAADGTWSVSVSSSDVAPGEYDSTITATTVDLAGNSSSTTSSVRIDTVSEVSLTNAPLTGDDVINEAEHSAGVTLTGTTQPGSSVEITVEGVTRQATVSADGSWSVTFTSGALPAGSYATVAMIVATDAAGNSASMSHGFAVDTDTAITIDTAGVETDGIVNAAERSDGVALSGEGEPGAAVTVSVAGLSLDTIVGANGVWTVTIPAASVPEGETSLAVSATSTDAAGNMATASGSIAIDTTTHVSVMTAGVEGDGVINAVEHSDGVTLTGTAEAGASVAVTLGGVTHAATVAGDGSWTADFSAAEIPTGEQVLNVTARATDAAGNIATATGTVDVDTFVRNFAITSTPGGADQVLNAAEAAQGLTLTGTTEPGSTVMLTLAGVTQSASVDANGNWTASFAAGQLPSGEQTVVLSAVATDAAGNTETLTQDVRIDTEAPDPLDWIGYGRNHAGVDEIRTEITGDDVYIGHVVGTDENPAIVEVDVANAVDVAPLGTTYHSFAGEVADGSHLVLTATDAAGNAAGSYLVTDDPVTSDVTMTDALASALSEFQIEAIDLQFAEDSHLTITEAQILALSDTTDTLVVDGGVDDSVTISGAQAAGTAHQDGNSYNVFTLGGATVLIDDDITNVNTGVV